MEKLHEKIRSVRKSKGITQKELAFKIGISQPTLHKIESGFETSISIFDAKKIAEVLDVDFCEFFDIKQPNNYNELNALKHEIRELKTELKYKEDFLKNLSDIIMFQKRIYGSRELKSTAKRAE